MPNPKQTPSELDWNFDAVSNDELVACCHWEYARESAFIRQLRQRCMKDQEADGERDEQLHQDLQKVQSIGFPATMLLHGFFCPPDGVLPDALPLRKGEVHRLTGSFPKSWQLLTREEREYRSFIPPRGVVGLVQLEPFGRGSVLDAKEIIKTATQQRRLADHENGMVRREHPGWCEEALAQHGKLKYPNIPAAVIYGSGTEYTVAQINWGVFSNEEIVQSFRQWVKANRPNDIQPPSGKGYKLNDWRVALERLGIMRLLHEFRLSEVRNACPTAWKLYGKREWYKERKRAGEMFHQIFPFLATSERPLNWPTRGGRGK